jgi:hypothetical protein
MLAPYSAKYLFAQFLEQRIQKHLQHRSGIIHMHNQGLPVESAKEILKAVWLPLTATKLGLAYVLSGNEGVPLH